jgi:hypothetical protein
MITLYPLKYNNYYGYYKSLNFTLNEANLNLNIKGAFANQNINMNIQINKQALITSNTVINNSLTVLYTYLLVDLISYTYASNSLSFNSSAPHKPEFILYLDNSYNSINEYVNLVTTNPNYNLTPVNNQNSSPTGSTTTSSTQYIIDTSSLTSVYSLLSGTSNYAYRSLTTQYSVTANYSYTAEYAKYVLNTLNFDVYNNLLYTYLYVSNSFPTNPIDYDSYYDINNKKLYLYVNGAWQEINWQEYIKYDSLYEEGGLRINPSTTALEVLVSNTQWFEIIPTIGNIVIPVNNSNSYIYYIAPGQTYYGTSISILPVFVPYIKYIAFEGTFSSTRSGIPGIFPSGYANFVQLSNNPVHHATYEILIKSKAYYITSTGIYSDTAVASYGATYSVTSGNIYYLGALGINNTVYPFEHIAVTRKF